MFSKVEIGDILCYRTQPKDWLGDAIKFMSYGGKYSHVAIYSGKDMIIESHIETGVVEKELNPKWHPFIDVYRVNYGLTISQKLKLIKYARENELGKQYDLAAFPSAFAKSTLATIFGWKNFKKSRPLLNDEDHRFCSELVGACFKLGLGIDVHPDIEYHSLTPSDFGRSYLLTLMEDKDAA